MIAASLAMLVVLLSLASVSPQLHDLLHAHSEHAHVEHEHAEHTHHHTDDHAHQHDTDHSDETTHHSEQSDSHFCGVTLLNSGVVFTALAQLPQQGDLQFVSLAIGCEKVWFHQIISSQSARGPPTIIVV